MKALVIILLIILAIVGGIYFAISTTQAVDVNWTEQDYQSYATKIETLAVANGQAGGANSEGTADSSGNSASENKAVEKPFPATATFTSKEISAMVSKECAATNSPVRDVKVKFLPGNMLEASFVTTDKMKELIPQSELEKYKVAENLIANRPVYIKMKVEKASAKTIAIDLQNAKVGRVGVPASVVQVAGEAIETAVNKQLQTLENFSIDEFSFDNDTANFKGNLQSKPRVLN